MLYAHLSYSALKPFPLEQRYAHKCILIDMFVLAQCSVQLLLERGGKIQCLLTMSLVIFLLCLLHPLLIEQKENFFC